MGHHKKRQMDCKTEFVLFTENKELLIWEWICLGCGKILSTKRFAKAPTKCGTLRIRSYRTYE